MRAPLVKSIGLSGILVLSACASPDRAAQYSSSKAGFSSVSSRTLEATGKDTVWLQNTAEAAANTARVHGLVHKKTISADTAVQVALLNNKGLQAAYADLGISGADAWQETMMPNPAISIGMTGIGAAGLNGFRTIEGLIASNIIALTTQSQRISIADVKFRQAQLRAAEETMKIAIDTRMAWVDAVAAFEVGGLIRQAEETADAASELAERLGEVGSMPKAEQAREHAFYAELTAERAKARLKAAIAKEKLTRNMGLWGAEVDYLVPDALPALPRAIVQKPKIEAEALTNRTDLGFARLELEASAKEYGLTDATRFLTDLEIAGGIESERENDGGEINTTHTGSVEVAFELPIYDSGKARLKTSEAAYMRAANLVAEKAVNIRSEARSAYLAYTATHRIARHYQTAVLPLRKTIEEEGLLSYNGMITNTFELVEDTSARLESQILETEARRDFWVADTEMTAAIYGGGASTTGMSGGEE